MTGDTELHSNYRATSPARISYLNKSGQCLPRSERLEGSSHTSQLIPRTEPVSSQAPFFCDIFFSQPFISNFAKGKTGGNRRRREETGGDGRRREEMGRG